MFPKSFRSNGPVNFNPPPLWGVGCHSQPPRSLVPPTPLSIPAFSKPTFHPSTGRFSCGAFRVLIEISHRMAASFCDTFGSDAAFEKIDSANFFPLPRSHTFFRLPTTFGRSGWCWFSLLDCIRLSSEVLRLSLFQYNVKRLLTVRFSFPEHPSLLCCSPLKNKTFLTPRTCPPLPPPRCMQFPFIRRYYACT